VELPGLARDALGDDPCVLVDQDAHARVPSDAYFTAATILVAVFEVPW
jgi:hypothetical protein